MPLYTIPDMVMFINSSDLTTAVEKEGENPCQLVSNTYHRETYTVKMKFQISV